MHIRVKQRKPNVGHLDTENLAHCVQSRKIMNSKEGKKMYRSLKLVFTFFLNECVACVFYVEVVPMFMLRLQIVSIKRLQSIINGNFKVIDQIKSICTSLKS